MRATYLGKQLLHSRRCKGYTPDLTVRRSIEILTSPHAYMSGTSVAACPPQAWTDARNRCAHSKGGRDDSSSRNPRRGSVGGFGRGRGNVGSDEDRPPGPAEGNGPEAGYDGPEDGSEDRPEDRGHGQGRPRQHRHARRRHPALDPGAAESS